MDEPQAPAAGADELALTSQVQQFLEELAVGSTSNLIGVLQDVQDRFGYLPTEAIEAVATRTKTPLASVYGVVSFYSQFYTTPHGRHTVRVCRGTACHVKGASAVLEAIQNSLDIQDGQTTEDKVFFLETVACLGTCFLAPVMMIGDEYFGDLAAGDVDTILNNYREAAS